MMRRILVALDGSPSSLQASRAGFGLARAGQARVDGLALVPPAMGDAAAAGAGEQAGSVMQAFRQEAERIGVPPPDVRAVSGSPLGVIRDEAVEYDLIVLGRESMFDVNGEMCTLPLCIDRIIREEPRPVLLVPEKPTATDQDGSSTPILVAFDGSPASSRTLHMFALLGLADGRTVHVITLDPTSVQQAESTAARACSLLRHHGAADAHAIGRDAGTPPDAILEAAGALGAGMVVMGAYGTRGIREIFGSCTRAVLHAAPVPLFLHH
jgi:nucleotide-binding universal stress UspA family protein